MSCAKLPMLDPQRTIADTVPKNSAASNWFMVHADLGSFHAPSIGLQDLLISGGDEPSIKLDRLKCVGPIPDPRLSVNTIVFGHAFIAYTNWSRSSRSSSSTSYLYHLF